MAGFRRNRDEEVNYAYIRDTEIEVDQDVVRTSFVRLVRPCTMQPGNTLITEAHVDVDGNGDIVGISLLWD